MGSSITTLPRPALSIGIEGMSCSSCAARVEKVLGRLPGISKATVSFSTESALLESDSVIDLATVRRAIEKAGFHVPEEDQVLTITGMTCSSCAAVSVKPAASFRRAFRSGEFLPSSIEHGRPGNGQGGNGALASA